MRRAAIFILSDVRSGSTLLDQCLGAHPQIVSLGEVHWLQAYLSQDRRLYDPEHPLTCFCGKPVAACPFWMDVARHLQRPLDTLRLHSKFNSDEGGFRRWSSVARLPMRLLRQAPQMFRFRLAQALLGGPRLARDSIQLFDAVSGSTGCALCVDSSKSPLRFRSVYAAQPHRTLAIVLSRDYRAVVHSKMKRGAKFDVAALGWRRKMHQIDVLTRDLSQHTVHHVRYEDLCANPRAQLISICQFLDVEFTEAMLQRPMSDVHHIGGSPSKLDPNRSRIEMDRSYVNRFQGEELARLQSLVGNEAGRWGY